ncbi:protein ripply1 [Rhineura floridana]|uniref:protein ripply1 n=1 Tax=Rhineura floridana TaxID=261503 RepID=UPI002AC865C6|nr:protein ripply1 [Rhineura floridana]XP_061454755.1 protein ripply1 [Rhineura floridana]
MEAATQRCPEQPVEMENHIQGSRPGGGIRLLALWRPWLPTLQEATREVKRLASPGCGTSKELQDFRHPVRLCWPKSRSFDYLYAEGEKLLENFPVQATINLYEDSEEDEEEEEEEEGAAPLPEAGAGLPWRGQLPSQTLPRGLLPPTH